MAMTIREAQDIAGALGHPSKMPGYSYGISAKNCITGSKLRKVPGSVCSSCYAMTDWYHSWRPLLMGHARRWNGLRHPRWVDAMVRMISSACTPPDNYFRWHDSGDLQGLWHLENIVRVAERTPEVNHWIPTREYGIVAAFLTSARESTSRDARTSPATSAGESTSPDRDSGCLATGKFPPNLTVRLSAHMIDAEPVFGELAPVLDHLPISTVSTMSTLMTGMQIVEGKGSVECRAVEARDNKCGSCRACWEPRVKNVTYPQH